MSIGDILSAVGRGAADVGRVAGAVLEPLGERTAQVISGEAPQIDEEKRQQAMQLTNQQRELKANELEQQLEMGRKYGTLTPDQQKQYVDAITGLYSKPEDQGSLLQRLHRAIHPQGTVRQVAQTLPNAVPEGGTAAADEAAKERELQARMQASKPNYKAYKLPDDSIVNVDVAHEAPPDGAVPVNPESANQQALNEYHAAQLDLRQKEIELKKAQFEASQDPNNQATRLKLMSAEANLTKAQSYALRAQAGALGTYNGKALHGALLDASGNPIGSMFAPNVRPTGTEIGRADLATSALDQMADMASILKKHPEIFGPAAGRATRISQWIGSQDPDAQRFQAAAVTAADHLMGVFGGRSTWAGQRITEAMGELKTNPEAALAALDQMGKAARIIQQRGTRKVVGGILQNQTGAKPISPPNPSGRIRVRLKNGKTGTIEASQFDPATMTKVQ